MELAESVAQNELSVRALEEIVRRERRRRLDSSGGIADREAPSPHLRDLRSRFEGAVKTKVMIQEGRRRGTGRIILEYYSLDDFERLAELLGVKLD